MGPHRRRRVLLAEDNTDLRAMWGVFLDTSDPEVVEACNGAEAVELARSSRPDLVVMDL